MVKTAMINLVHPRPTSFSKACSMGTSGSKPVGLEYFQKETFRRRLFSAAARKCIIRCVKCNRAIVVGRGNIWMPAEPQKPNGTQPNAFPSSQQMIPKLYKSHQRGKFWLSQRDNSDADTFSLLAKLGCNVAERWMQAIAAFFHAFMTVCDRHDVIKQVLHYSQTCVELNLQKLEKLALEIYLCGISRKT